MSAWLRGPAHKRTLQAALHDKLPCCLGPVLCVHAGASLCWCRLTRLRLMWGETVRMRPSPASRSSDARVADLCTACSACMVSWAVLQPAAPLVSKGSVA